MIREQIIELCQQYQVAVSIETRDIPGTWSANTPKWHTAVVVVSNTHTKLTGIGQDRDAGVALDEAWRRVLGKVNALDGLG